MASFESSKRYTIILLYLLVRMQGHFGLMGYGRLSCATQKDTLLFSKRHKPKEIDIMSRTKTTSAVSKDKEPRAELGIWLKSLREVRGLSQRQLANQLELDYYTFISQLETGRGKIPSSRYLDWAKALDQDPKTFMKILLRYYEPEAYEMLFGDSKAI